jgi:putative methyltransferase (TIGR04325 family)
MRARIARLFTKRPEPVAAPIEDRIRFEGDFNSYEEALAACNGSAGYSSDTAIERSIKRYQEVSADPAKAIRDASDQVIRFMAAFSLCKPIDGVYRVYDLGGGYGAIYHLFRYLYPDARFHWTVVELPALVARASEIGASAEKEFSTEIPPGPYSLGISSGTLQYLKDPSAGLANMAVANAAVTYLNRFPLDRRSIKDRLAVQHVPSSYFEASFPVWFFSLKWERSFPGLGNLLAEWNSPGDVVELDGKTLAYSAFLFKRP